MRRPSRVDAHEALLDAALDAFARRGLERARVEDIAHRARISKGAFYLHFATKEDAFREVLSRFLGVLRDHARRRAELEVRCRKSDARDGVSRIEAECAADLEVLEVLWRNRQILAAVEGASTPASRELVVDFRRQLRAFVAECTAARMCVGARVRGDVAPELVAGIVVGAYEALARRMTEMKDKPDLAAWARALLRVLFGGILARPPPAPRPPRGPSPRPRAARRVADPPVTCKESR